MPKRDEDFVPYQDRTLAWERQAKHPLAAETDRHGASPPRPSPLAGCLRGCGCVLVLGVVILVAAAIALRNAPARIAAAALTTLVRGAVNGDMTVNGEPVTVPEAWRTPWQQTAEAYADAFLADRIEGDHFTGTLLEHWDAIRSEGGELPDTVIRALCERMRGQLPQEERDRLAPLPPAPEPVDAIAADVRPEADFPGWPPRAALHVSERTRQYNVRRRLLERLSRMQGPATAQQLVPENAVIYDFQYDMPPFTLLMDDWRINTPEDHSIEPGWNPNRGFSAAPSIYFTVTPAAAESEASIEFSTTAASVQGWYLFDGPVRNGMVQVLVNDEPVYDDPWPTAAPGALAAEDWRHIHLSGLDTDSATRITFRLSAGATERPAILYMDDLVFAP